MKIKRMLSLILAAALLLSLPIAGPVRVRAAYEIEVMELGSLTVEAGEPIPESIAGDPCASITSTVWEVWNYDTLSWEECSGSFASGQVYRLYIRAEAVEGNYFYEGSGYFFANERLWRNVNTIAEDGSWADISLIFPVDITLIERMSIGRSPEVYAGITTDDALKLLSISENDSFTQQAPQWYVVGEDGSLEDFSGTFQENQEYVLRLDMVANEGYWFDDYVGMNGHVSYVDDSDRVEGQEGIFRIDMRYDTYADINSTAITVSGVELGNTAEDVSASVAADALYTVESVQVLYSGGESEFQGEFGKNSYLVVLTLKAADGYRFRYYTDWEVNGEAADGEADGAYAYVTYEAELRTVIESLEVTVTGLEAEGDPAAVEVSVPDGAHCNVSTFNIYTDSYDLAEDTLPTTGYIVDIYLSADDTYCFTADSRITINGQEPGYFGEDGDTCNVELRGDFRTLIEKVEVTATEPAEGMDAQTLMDSVTVPENACYTIDQVIIFDNNSSEYIGALGASEYAYNICLAAAEGYYFDDSKTQVLLNGKAVDTYYDSGSTELFLEHWYFTGQYLDKIELPAWPEPQVGDTIPESQMFTLGENGYRYYLRWLVMNGSQTAQASGQFQDDTAYVLVLTVMSGDSYRFSDDVLVTVGGKQITPAEIYANMAIFAYHTVVLGDVNILTEIPVSAQLPAAGEEPGEITWSGEGYTISAYAWGVGSSNDPYSAKALDGAYQEGDYAFLGLTVLVDTGYSVALDAAVVINGTRYPTTQMGTNGNRIFQAAHLGKISGSTGSTVSGSYASFGSEEAALTVELFTGEAEQAAYTFTNEASPANSGTWSIQGVADGEYTVKVSKENHTVREYTLTVDGSGQLDVELWLTGDVNGDGLVNFSDYSKVLSQSKNPASQVLADYAFASGDVNGDGIINFSDYSQVLSQAKGKHSLW